MKTSVKALTLMLVNLLCLLPVLAKATDVCPPIMLVAVDENEVTALPTSTNDQSEAAKLLEESHQISAKLSDQDRAFFLTRLTNISTTIAPSRTKDWCKELLDLAKTRLPAEWNRVATEKNAVVPLVKSDVIRAFDLLSEIEKPIPTRSGGLNEDVRADAATKIFPSYLNTVGIEKGVPEIKAKAIEIGGPGGEFPHRAVGLVIEQLQAAGELESASTLFDSALNFYKKGSAFEDEDPEFFELLQSARGAVPTELYKTALIELVIHLTTDKSKEPKPFKAQVRNADGIFDFDSQKKLLLFQVMPILKQFGVPVAESLMGGDKSLVHALAGPPSIAAAGSSGNTLPEHQAAAQRRAGELVTIGRIRQLQEFDSLAALSEAWRLPVNSPDRATAFAEIIPSLVHVDAAKAREAYLELQSTIDELPGDTDRLHGIVAAAKAAYSLNYRNDFARHAARAWDYGLQIANQDIQRKKESLTLLRPGTKDLLDLAEFTAEHSGSTMLKWIRPIDNNGLKAYLLLYAAKGLGNAEIQSRILATK